MVQNAFARLLKVAAKASALAICLTLSSTSLAERKDAAIAEAQARSSGPALWVVRDEDSTLYLFGTMHALSPDTLWHGPSIKAAMAGSEEIWFEVEPPSDASAIQTLVMEFGIDRAKPLSAKLDAAGMATLSEAIGKMGMNMERADVMRPWLAAMTLTGLPLIEAGYDPAKGADALLLAAAKASGQRVRTFETAEQQMRFFADLPAEVELELLRETLKSYKDGAASVRWMETAWASGDDKRVWELGGESMRAQFPAVYAALLSRRNMKWAEILAKELEGAGTDFVAVGSLHLLGPDSVQSLLEARGYKVERQRPQPVVER